MIRIYAITNRMDQCVNVACLCAAQHHRQVLWLFIEFGDHLLVEIASKRSPFTRSGRAFDAFVAKVLGEALVDLSMIRRQADVSGWAEVYTKRVM